MMEFHSEKLYKAKKEHYCEHCGTKIKIGEKYFYQSGKFDKEFFARYSHLRCEPFAEFLNKYEEDVYSWVVRKPFKV